jgi:hypothetical protein
VLVSMRSSLWLRYFSLLLITWRCREIIKGRCRGDAAEVLLLAADHLVRGRGRG